MNFLKPKFWDKKQISIFSILLAPIAFFVKLLFFLKRFGTKSHKCSIPVICIGNIYLGGTGKTPLSIETFLILKDLKMNPAFIRKEYDDFIDETNLQKKIGSVYMDKKRLNAIKSAIKNKKNVAILDDGFQDFSIKKDLSIICFNEKQWIGNGFTIPSGPLREKLSALKRAEIVVITGHKNFSIEKNIFYENKNIKIFYAKYKPQNIHEFKNNKVIAFAGIGNPENFFELLKENNVDIVEKIKFPDHHKYSHQELKNLFDKIEGNNKILLTTEKDYLRIDEYSRKDISFLKITTEIENRNEFINELKKII